MKEIPSTTQISRPIKQGDQRPSVLVVTYTDEAGIMVAKKLDSTFSIGRDDSCQIQLLDEVVSKIHAEVELDQAGWWVRDLGSTNGTFLDGQRIERVQLTKSSTLQIAPDGPILAITLEPIRKSSPKLTPHQRPTGKTKEALPSTTKDPAVGQVNNRGEVDSQVAATSGQKEKTNPSQDDKQKPKTSDPQTVTDVIRHYFSSDSGEAGAHTRMVREAYTKVRSRLAKRYWIAICVVLTLFTGTLIVLFIQQGRIENLRKMAVEIFYNMKSIEVQIEQILAKLESTGDTTYRSVIEQKRKQLVAMQEQYDRFIDQIGLFGKSTAREERLILRMARVFGECELNVPEGFVTKVQEYIKKWKTTPRLEQAIARASANNYSSRVFHQMVKRNLPPQFFYLGLQESDFNERAVGPKTRYGIAKGFWQFIPATAIQYGLATGPLVELRRYDPMDERFDFDKSTMAAAKYLKYIYGTEAQASGLLVMASYNWGHNNVRKRIRELPADPRKRNFWQLLEKHKIPSQTYDYVFYIFAAAVIGEDPSFFGYRFKNPLKGLDEKMTAEEIRTQSRRNN